MPSYGLGSYCIVAITINFGKGKSRLKRDTLRSLTPSGVGLSSSLPPLALFPHSGILFPLKTPLFQSRETYD